MGRTALIIVVGFGILAFVAKFSFMRAGRSAGELSASGFEEKTARNTAHGAAQMALNKLHNDMDWRSGFTNLTLSGGIANLTVFDSSTDSTLGQDTLRFVSQGECGDASAAVIMKIAVGRFSLPGNINSGITARANIGTLGNMCVDGRDHTINGALLSNQGTYAITTTQNYFCGGSTSLYGTTVAGADLGPLKTNYEDIVQENYSWPGTYPNTPEEVLGGSAAGLGANALKTIAQSGYGGSQYVTNPANLIYPLRGVTYVEMGYNGTWSPVNYGHSSSGILVVHNEYRNSLMENLNSSTFKGLIIADDVLHIHSTIIGGLFLLTSAPHSGNCIGNGTGSVLFSREAIIQAMEDSQTGAATIAVIECYE